MARIGFKKAKYNLIDSETMKYKAVTGGVPMFEKVVDEKFSPEYNSAELYANDSLCESDYTFKKGSLSITVADDEDSFCATILGNNISTEETYKGEVTCNIDDNPPECCYGHIIPKIVGGKRKYKVEFFPRVKFKSVTSEAKTKGDSAEFTTASIEGTVFPLEENLGKCSTGDWEKHKTFDTLALAETYLDGLMTPEA